jgi:hypothetical protein
MTSSIVFLYSKKCYHFSMPLTLNLEPNLEQRLRLEAEQHGLPLETWLTQELEQRFQVSASEATLLQRITMGLPESFWVRYRVLVQKRDAENLEPGEQLELISMSDQTEQLTLQRTQALLELAKRRNTTIDALQVQYGLQPVALLS